MPFEGSEIYTKKVRSDSSVFHKSMLLMEHLLICLFLLPIFVPSDRNAHIKSLTHGKSSKVIVLILMSILPLLKKSTAASFCTHCEVLYMFYKVHIFDESVHIFDESGPLFRNQGKLIQLKKSV